MRANERPVLRRLARTNGGRMVHRAECSYAMRAHAAPWLWAVTATAAAVMDAIDQFGYRRCKVCKPLDGEELRVAKVIPLHRGKKKGLDYHG